MNKTEIERQMTVVKSNEIIRKGRFKLTLTEQRIVLYIISKIQPCDTDFKWLTISIRDFCAVAGIEYLQNLTDLKSSIKCLADKSMWITRPGKRTQTLIRWIEKPEIEPDSDTIKIRLDSDLVPYLLQLRRDFTAYQLINVLAMGSKYSIQLYELFRSYLHVGYHDADVSEIKEYLMVSEKYKETKYFYRDVIVPALQEINDYTDVEVTCSPIKQGRTIIGYHFDISQQQDDPGHILAMAAIEGRRPSRHKRNKMWKEITENVERGLNGT